MGAVANTIGESLNATALWGVVSDVLPIILPLVLFAFGFFLVRKVINKSTQGKAKI